MASTRGLWSISFFVLIADQITKWLVLAFLELHESVSVFGDWLRFTSIRNPGGAFGLRWGHDIVYYVSAALIIAWIVWQLKRDGATRRLSMWALALILGGALGNLVDRVLYGEVIDFIDVEFFDMVVPAFDFGVIRHPGYLLDRWPTFNIADSAVTVGICALLFTLWRDPVIGQSGDSEPLPAASSDTNVPVDDGDNNALS
jgi:signal peptidase II